MDSPTAKYCILLFIIVYLRYYFNFLSLGYPTVPPQPPQPTPPTGGPSGGYTLPPTVAYFPVTAYTNSGMDQTAQVMMSQESLNQLQQQPNTPDLLMHRRQVRERSFE